MVLKLGERVDGRTGAVTIGPELGTGGQGTVYQARTADGREVAVKWYLPDFQVPDLRESITELVSLKAPSGHFLWPEDIVERGGEFGYVMPLRPQEFYGLTRVLKRTVKTSLRELVRGAEQTVAAFKALQAKGYFYCDISDANLFIDPNSGDILICDNDNVGTSRTRPRVLGTARFMAPEIVRGEVKPSALTDNFSMAVLLFLLLINAHPLEGENESRIKVFNAAAMNRIYGEKPVFVHDPQDSSNRPIPGIHDNARVFWTIYPQPIRDIFIRAFTSGLVDPGRRPSFSEWQTALGSCADSLVFCHCGKQNFADLAATAPLRCWGCGETVKLPYRLVVGRSVVMLNEGTVLFDHHLGRGGDRADPGAARATVVRHPSQDILGLRNDSGNSWYAQAPDRQVRTVDPGRSVALRAGTSVGFGSADGIVEI